MLALQQNVSKFSEGLQISTFLAEDKSVSKWQDENLYNKIESGENATSNIKSIHHFLDGLNIRQVNIQNFMALKNKNIVSK